MNPMELEDGRKRKRGKSEESSTAAPTANSTSSSSNIIGLEFTDGRVLYCHRSTLLNAEGYFAACFGDNGIPAREQRKDAHGRSFFFIERDPDLFQHHIFPYILQQIPGKLPPFTKDRELWRLLRIVGNDKGVLYWLGTNKGTTNYENPYTIGAVNVTVGGLADATYEEISEIFDGADGPIVYSQAYAPESRQALVQYRPPVFGKDREDREGFIYLFLSLHQCYSLWCDMSTYMFPTVINRLSLTLRPTAYSLRYDYHNGMTDWNLEGSKDRSSWVVLHKARNDHQITVADNSLRARLSADFDRCKTDEEKEAALLEFVERERRGTWHISPTSNEFYQYFRIIGSGADYERSETSSTCLHGVGLELYGDIHED